jgi:hypothetical protein
MKIAIIIVFAFLSASATAIVLTENPKRQSSDLSPISLFNFSVAHLPAFVPDDIANAVVGGDAWILSIQRGDKLFEGMKASDEEAGSLYSMSASAESPYDGKVYTTPSSHGATTTMLKPCKRFPTKNATWTVLLDTCSRRPSTSSE